jgi:hypothetical protein
MHHRFPGALPRTLEGRVLEALHWSAAPSSLDLLAARTVLPREDVADGLRGLLASGRIVQVPASTPPAPVWHAAYLPVPSPCPPLALLPSRSRHGRRRPLAV